eukprot:233911-Rhodomonas_salina.2
MFAATPRRGTVVNGTKAQRYLPTSGHFGNTTRVILLASALAPWSRGTTSRESVRSRSAQLSEVAENRSSEICSRIESDFAWT